WTDAIPVAMRAHVEQALAGHTYDTSVAWPAGGAVGSKALDALVAAGTSTLLLNSTAVTPQPAAGTVPAALTQVRSGRQDLAVGLLNPTLQRSVADAVALTGAGPAALPPLVAELAVRAAQQPGREHAAVLATPRYVDPSVTYAVRTIE